jgi:glucokinase
MEYLKSSSKPMLVADIGGTNANFGIVVFKDSHYQLLETYRVPSQTIGDFTPFMASLLEKIAQEKHIAISALAIGIAGPLCGSQHNIQLTNLPFSINKPELIKAIGITDIVIMNDFIAVACGYDLVENTIALNTVAPKERAQKAFIGAGTGLGQAMAVWSKKENIYLPLASEGGHTEWVTYDNFDSELHAFIQQRYAQQAPIIWEQVLSGKGVSLIYEFLGLQKHYPETAISQEIAQNRFQPDLISRYAQSDERCMQVFKLYKTYYARFAKQVALQSVACGGLYIAGGIAAKNKELFLDAEFMHEFTQHVQHRKFLEKIPIFLIQDYQVSLYGGAQYYTLHTLDLV